MESPERFASDRAAQRPAINWLILIATQMIIPQSAKLICSASAIANPARILAIALLNDVIWS
jgi:hypothetical protein